MTSLWSLQTTPVDNNWNSVTYGKNLYVAVANSGGTNRVMTSSNGITWTARSGNNYNANYVTYGNNYYIITTSSTGLGKVIYSTDAINWFFVSGANINSGYWYGAIYANGLYVVCGTNSGNSIATASTANGSWTTRSAPTNVWCSVTYGNGLFLCVANAGTNRVMTSSTGTSGWTANGGIPDNNWSSVTYGNSLFVAVANSGTGNRVVTSPDGTTWTARSAPDYDWTSITYGNNLFVAVASSGIGNRVMTSPDGITWTSSSSAADNNWTSVTYGNNLFVAVANSGTGNRIMTATTTQPTITNFSIPTKTFGDAPFTITAPTSNSSGAFSYTSSNTSVATISGDTITIVGGGNSTITATQAATTSYTSGQITAPFQVNNQSAPTITNFSIPIKSVGDAPFTITAPTSNSAGAFSYTSSNTSVATISGNTITIVGAGNSTITATQAPSGNYTSGTITTKFQVITLSNKLQNAGTDLDLIFQLYQSGDIVQGTSTNIKSGGVDMSTMYAGRDNKSANAVTSTTNWKYNKNGTPTDISELFNKFQSTYDVTISGTVTYNGSGQAPTITHLPSNTPVQATLNPSTKTERGTYTITGDSTTGFEVILPGNYQPGNYTGSFTIQ
jgi:hypothetical protein